MAETSNVDKWQYHKSKENELLNWNYLGFLLEWHHSNSHSSCEYRKNPADYRTQIWTWIFQDQPFPNFYFHETLSLYKIKIVFLGDFLSLNYSTKYLEAWVLLFKLISDIDLCSLLMIYQWKFWNLISFTCPFDILLQFTH